MASTKEIKNRMKSIRDTQKITNAMYLIASTKVRKAREELDHTRPYFDALRAEIKRIFRVENDIENDIDSKYFYPKSGIPRSIEKCAFLVITADKGLAGAYNQNVLKETKRLLSEHEGAKLFVVGEYGRQFFKKQHIPIERSFLYTAQNPNMYRAREITNCLLDVFDRGEANKIFVIYTDMRNGLTEEVSSTRILPFHRNQFEDSDEKPLTSSFEFTPGIGVVLDNIMQSYVSGFIYSALVDSFCSEQNARMVAMKAANQNAESILSELSVQYNQVRQAAITQEITEVSAGAKAQKKKRKKLGGT